MRGVGKRMTQESAAEGSKRAVPIMRKPVPSTVYENSPRSSIRYSAVPVESSAMQEITREPSPPTPEASDAPYIRFALDQLTNDPDDKGERMPLAESFDEKPALSLFPSDIEPVNPLRSHPVFQRDAPSPPVPPRSPRRSETPIPHQSDLFMPFDPQSDSFHRPLTALPSTLRPLRLGLFILVLTSYIVCLLFCAIWSRVHTGLTGYGSFGDGRYFLWEYLPTMLGMALVLWLFEIESAVFRVAPFIALTSKSSTRSRSNAPFLPLTPSNFLLPSLVHLKTGQAVITVFLFTSWLALLTVPLLGSSFNVYYQNGRWVWLATQGVLWTAIALYVLLLGATVALFFHLQKRQTGLKWDARSLADITTVIQASNSLESYANYPFLTDQLEVMDSIAERQDGLGYFHSSARPSEIYHTLGSPEQLTRAGAENIRRSHTTSRLSTYAIDPESGRPYSEYSNGTWNSAEAVLPQDMVASWQSHIPWFMRTSLVVLWIIAAIVLLLAFLVVSYLPSTTVRNGFLPELSVIQSNFGFSAANFLYSFIPSLLGLLCLLVWQPFDLAFRRLQPYASLCNPGGEVAEKSLLLSYAADAPVSVTLKAAVNRHLRVALASITTLIAATLPILGGGIFWSQFSVSQQRVRIYAHMPAYYALTVFFTLYCLSYIFTFPGRNRRLPNKGRSLADLIAFVHQSKLLDDAEFRAPATKIALITRLIVARPGVGNRLSIQDREKLAAGATADPALDIQTQPQTYLSSEIVGTAPTASKVSLADSLRGIAQARRDANAEKRFSGGAPAPLEQPKYGFGRYIGRDGREWLGIDKVGRPGRPASEMVIRE